jgi:segregation and condensation protein B
MSLKPRIEAVLFLTDKPLAAAAIAQLVNVDVQAVRQSILELIHDYEERNSALEIADDGGYMMQVKDEYATFANDLAPIDLPVSVVRTLSAIAIKQPVLQSEIVRIRGAGAYDHVKELLEKELITKKEEGRSPLLGTTKKFQEYFRLSQDAKTLRSQLKEQAKTEPPAEEETTAQESVNGESPIVDNDNIVAEDNSSIPESENTTIEDNSSIPENDNSIAGRTSALTEDDMTMPDSKTEFVSSNTT